MIKYKIATQIQTKDHIRLALAHRLHLPKSGSLKEYLEKGLATRRDAKIFSRQRTAIGLAFDGDEPIAVVFCFGWTFSIYVKKKYRGQGIGGKLVKTFLTTYPFKQTVLVGTSKLPGSRKFWKSLGFDPYTTENFLTKLWAL